MTFADEVNGVTSWLLIDNGERKPKVYVNISCIEPPAMVEVHRRNIGKMDYDNQFRQFLKDRQLTLGDNGATGSMVN